MIPIHKDIIFALLPISCGIVYAFRCPNASSFHVTILDFLQSQLRVTHYMLEVAALYGEFSSFSRKRSSIRAR